MFPVEEDQLSVWIERFLDAEIRGVRSVEVEKKIALQIGRFVDFFRSRYKHERVSAVMKRDVVAWIKELYGDPDKPGEYAASTVNNHKAHLSLWMSWLHRKAPHLLPDDPTKGRELKDIQLPAPEPRALTDEQQLSLRNVCDRLERFHQLRGRQWKGDPSPPIRKNARPKRDRAIMFVFLGTGIRREMLVNLDLQQLEPSDPDQLRRARKAVIRRIRGKGRTEQTKYLEYEERMALADYLEHERPIDAEGDPDAKAIFLVAKEVPERRSGGRLRPEQINRIVSRIGKWHDAEQADPERHVSPLTPHDLRHTYGFGLSMRSGGDRYRLQQELGHRNERYIETYVNPPEEYRAGNRTDL